MTLEKTTTRTATQAFLRRIGENAQRFACDRTASNAIEYALLTFIAAAIILAVSQLGDAVSALYVQVQNAVSSF